MTRTQIAIVVSIALSQASVASASGRFVPLPAIGHTPGGVSITQVAGISDNGAAIVGMTTTSTGFQPFRWTEASGMQLLTGATPLGLAVSNVLGVSGDGNVVFGRLESSSRSYKWSATTGYSSVSMTHIQKASFDGSQFLEGPPHVDWSDDGTIRVGSGTSPFGGGEAFLETTSTCGCPARQWLGELPGGDYGSSANAMNGAGNIVVGSSSYAYTDTNSISKPFIWTAASGMRGLSGVVTGIANVVSETGQVIAGGGALPGDTDWYPFRWTITTGAKHLSDLLLSEGVNVSAMGWRLGSYEIYGSTNGRIFAGTGTNPQGNEQGWMIELDIPGDFDRNGSVDGGDFLHWQRNDRTSDRLSLWRQTYWSPFDAGALGVPVNSVPEPSANWLICLGTILVWARQPARGH